MVEGQSTHAEGEGDVEQMQDRALDRLKEARGTIETFARENPRTAVAIALGVGFVLGGGLTPRLLVGLGAIAARRFAREVAREQLAGIGKSVLANGDAGERGRPSA